MREILFRGKTKGNVNIKDGIWVVGLPFYTDHTIGGIESKDGELFTVIPETVGQYVGDDKYGSRIFEGDIVSDGFENDKVEYTESGAVIPFIYDTECSDCEVIGNIHDNPELLKEKDNERQRKAN